ncbi:sigma-70 family RNA polymerase sigma factor [Streptomyces sp. TRM 70361]|uniref:sigma-70 family RNA polymerase sigma factor n=1 Tax=Streptomyces sp. TRM 70361 TaxID=3116553 RepID=UPI002E7BC7F6|nr:sigma-70 family RNA polymerase sigma factor [Streptomyces sp. TRM 70361]MEE1940982.1 sigma-70 family RNA polymerase sigma factor [Streptomyces sp. TRM 70361]
MNRTVMGSTGAATARERAMRTLYDEQSGDLYAYVLRLLGGDQHRAEDVVQEALLRCWRTQDLESGRPLRPWLFRVARNLVVDEYRLRMARPQEVDGTAWLDELLARRDDIDRLLSSVILQGAFRTLSPKHREVLYETYYTGRSTREAALVLGIPPGTVKSRLYHAVRALRMALGLVAAPGEEVTAVPAWWRTPAA